MELETSQPDNPVHLPPSLKLSTFLQFLRTNSFHRAVGSQKGINISQAAACKTVNRVAKIFSLKQKQFIQFPTIQESQNIALEIYQEFKFPPVITGIIDCTHVHINKPVSVNPLPERFYNRKGFYSLNCLAVTDQNCKFLYFSARHCGSTHDAKIFGESALRQKLLKQFNKEKPIALLGDEGFGCEDVLLTPVRSRQLEAENDAALKAKMVNYNKAVRLLRVKVEHSFGILKKRFPALLYQLRSRKIFHAQNIAISSVVIHNILMEINDPALSLGNHKC